MTFTSAKSNVQVTEETVVRKTAMASGNIPSFDADGKMVDSGVAADKIITYKGSRNIDELLVWDRSGNAVSSGYTLSDMWFPGDYIPINGFKLYNNTNGDAIKVIDDYLTSSLSPTTKTGTVGTATAYSYLANSYAQNDNDTLYGYIYDTNLNVNLKTGVTRKPYSLRVGGIEAFSIEQSGVVSLKGSNGTGTNIVGFLPDSTLSRQTFQILSNAAQNSGISFVNSSLVALGNMRHYNVSDNVSSSYYAWQVGAGIFFARSGISNVATAFIHLDAVTATTQTPMRWTKSAVEKTSPLDGDWYYSSSGNMDGWKFRQGTQTIIIGGETGWLFPTGIATKGFAATYAGQTVSGAYSQSEVQSIDNLVKTHSQVLNALITFLGTNKMNLLRA